MRLWTVTGPLKSMVTASRYPFRCTVTPGKSIAAVYSNFRLPLELQFAMHRNISRVLQAKLSPIVFFIRHILVQRLS